MESGLEEVLRPWPVPFHFSRASLADGGVRLHFPARCPILFGGATLQLWVFWVSAAPLTVPLLGLASLVFHALGDCACRVPAVRRHHKFWTARRTLIYDPSVTVPLSSRS